MIEYETKHENLSLGRAHDISIGELNSVTERELQKEFRGNQTFPMNTGIFDCLKNSLFSNVVLLLASCRDPK